MRKASRYPRLGIVGTILWLALAFHPGVFLSAAHAEEATVQSVLGDENQFTAYAARAYQQALPGRTVTIKAPLLLSIGGLTGNSDEENDLHTIHSYCLNNPELCDRALLIHIAQMAATMTRPETAPDRANLRALVRTTAYVEAARRGLAGKGDPVAAPLIGDFWIICALDLPDAIQVLRPADLAALGLSPDEALAIAKQNVKASLAPLAPTLRDVPERGIDVVTGSPYASSWLIFPEAWAAEAERFKGELLVAVPATDGILYSSGSGKSAVTRLANAAASTIGRAERPLDTTVFRWTPQGWEIATP